MSQDAASSYQQNYSTGPSAATIIFAIISLVLGGVSIYLYMQLEEGKQTLAKEIRVKERLEGRVDEFERRVETLQEERNQANRQASSQLRELRDELASKQKLIDKQNELLSEPPTFEAKIPEFRLDREWREAVQEQGQLVAFLEKELAGTGMNVYRQDPYVIVQVPETTYASGSSAVSNQLLEGLKTVAEAFNAYKGTYLLAIEGHTDNVPTSRRSKFKTNWELGAARSGKVVQNLIRLGVEPQNLSLVSRSQYMPVNEHNNPTSDEENRRVELVFAPRRMIIKGGIVSDEISSGGAAPAIQTQ